MAFLSPQLLDLLRWGRSLSTAKAARELGFRAKRDTRAAFEDFIQQRRVLRYAPDRHARVVAVSDSRGENPPAI